MTFAKPLLKLLESLERLPGIGPRSAERIAFYLLRVPTQQTRQLAQAILDVKAQLRFCEICFNLTEEPRCEICQDSARDPAILCIVEEPKDVLSIEKTRSYPVRITRLASGIPVGSHLEYADQATLARALEGRREL